MRSKVFRVRVCRKRSTLDACSTPGNTDWTLREISLTLFEANTSSDSDIRLRMTLRCDAIRRSRIHQIAEAKERKADVNDNVGREEPSAGNQDDLCGIVNQQLVSVVERRDWTVLGSNPGDA